MRNPEYWKRFEKTGNISDYLNYIACTDENCTRHMAEEEEEGGFGGGGIDSDRDSVIRNADWGL